MALVTAPLSAGSHTITASYGGDNNFNAASSAPATVAVVVAVTTYHNDLNRTGVNAAETVLNTSNVNTTTFGKLYSRTVDGLVAAQPLYMPGVSIPAVGVRNVVYVATSHNTVYAFDADSATATSPLWTVNLGTPALWSVLMNSDVPGEVGIVGTPVIDASTNTLYAVAETWEAGDAAFRLHALDIRTGAEKFGGPRIIQGSVAGSGVGSVGGTLTFAPFWHQQRAGLMLVNGVVYVAFASHGDLGPFHGWFFGYRADTLQQVALFCPSPDADQSKSGRARSACRRSGRQHLPGDRKRNARRPGGRQRLRRQPRQAQHDGRIAAGRLLRAIQPGSAGGERPRLRHAVAAADSRYDARRRRREGRTSLCSRHPESLPLQRRRSGRAVVEAEQRTVRRECVLQLQALRREPEFSRQGFQLQRFDVQYHAVAQEASPIRGFVNEPPIALGQRHQAPAFSG